MSSSEDSSDSSTEFKSESSSESTSTSTSLSPLRVKKHGGSDSKRHSSGLRKKVITVEVKVILLLAEEIERAIEVSIKIEKRQGADPLRSLKKDEKNQDITSHQKGKDTKEVIQDL